MYVSLSDVLLVLVGYFAGGCFLTAFWRRTCYIRFLCIHQVQSCKWFLQNMIIKIPKFNVLLCFNFPLENSWLLPLSLNTCNTFDLHIANTQHLMLTFVFKDNKKFKYRIFQTNPTTFYTNFVCFYILLKILAKISMC